MHDSNQQQLRGTAVGSNDDLTTDWSGAYPQVPNRLRINPLRLGLALLIQQDRLQPHTPPLLRELLFSFQKKKH